jgi:hypothetical protein
VLPIPVVRALHSSMADARELRNNFITSKLQEYSMLEEKSLYQKCLLSNKKLASLIPVFREVCYNTHMKQFCIQIFETSIRTSCTRSFDSKCKSG